MRSRKLSATWLILGCLTVVGLTQLILGESRSFGAAAFDRPMIKMGEYWRLVTGSFLHIGWGHFTANVLEMALLAWFVEKLTSRHHLAIVFFVSCVAGGLASLMLLPEATSVGASDAVSGLFGFLLMQALLRRPYFPRGMWKVLVWYLGYSVVGEFSQAIEVNHVAHAGGFAVGLVLGTLMPMASERAIRWWGWSSRALIIASTLGGVVLSAAGRPGINALHTRAWEEDEAGDYEAAVHSYSDVLRIDPKYVPAYFGRASARWSLNDLEGALDDYDALIALEADDEDAWRARGTLRGEMGDLEGGLEDLNRCLTLNSRTERAHVERARIRFLRGEPEEAMKDIDSALSLDAKDPYAINIRGRIKASRGDFEGAIADQTQAMRRMRDQDAQIARGDARLAKGDLEGAANDYDSALKASPRDPDAFLGLGLVRMKQKNNEAAKYDFEAALKSAHRWWRRRAEAEAALKELR